MTLAYRRYPGSAAGVSVGLYTGGSMNNHVQPVALKVNDAAQALGVSARTVWKLIRSGTLPSLRIGTRVLVLYSSLQDYATSRADSSGSYARPDAAPRIAEANRSRARKAQEATA